MLQPKHKSGLSVSFGIGYFAVAISLLAGCGVDVPEKPASDNSAMFNKLHRESTMGSLNAIRTARISYVSETGNTARSINW